MKLEFTLSDAFPAVLICRIKKRNVMSSTDSVQIITVRSMKVLKYEEFTSQMSKVLL